MNPNFPFKTPYWINQMYGENQADYPTGRHGGLDIIPYQAGHVPFPADVYPVFPGRTLKVDNTDVDRGKGIRVRTPMWVELAEHLDSKDIEAGMYVEHLYWHFLEVTDLDMEVDTSTPLGKAGNTGLVWSSQFPEANGKLSPVPSKYKGVPPYYGLHTHLEFRTTDKTGNVLNKHIDVLGRLDPLIFLNFKQMITNVVIYKVGDEYQIAHRATNPFGFAQQLFDAGATSLLNSDGSPNFEEIDKIATVL